MALVFINIFLAFFFSANMANGIGVNWGSNTSHNLPPKITAQLLKDNGIGSVKLFGSDASMINALANVGINVMVGIANSDLKRFSENYDDAKDWVDKNVAKHVNDEGVNITYVSVGNEPFSKKYNGLYLKNTFMAIKNVQKALDEAGLGGTIKATTPFNEEVIDSTTKPPSECEFSKETKTIVVEMVRWFYTNKSPFVLNLNPFPSYRDLTFPEDAFFFSPNASTIVTDQSASYNNVFDLSIDCLVSSLKSAGVPNLKIVVGEIGWPTDGNIKANKTTAQRFYSGFLKKLGSEEGTPLRSGPIEVYLSSLLDENMRSIDEGNHERHLGIFAYDGIPKYQIDFSGQGKEAMPVAAKGVRYLMGLYCVYNPATDTNLSVVPATIDYICKAADCTALTYGSSCNGLDWAGNLTYMFNMYFQMYNNAPGSCTFNGLATLTMVNPSTATCLFPVQMMKNGGVGVALQASEIIVGVLAMVLLALLKEGL